jgi:Ca-activated chloride channel family protein
MLLTLLLAPVLVAGYLRLLRRREAARAALGPLGIVEGGGGIRARIRRHLPPSLMLLGLAVLAVALARPEAEVRLPRVEGTVILAFDVSNSMLADDLKPTRMEAAKEAARSFVEGQSPPIRIGVVTFGRGGALVQRPTGDRQAILAAIDRLSPQGGTSIGDGIFTSLTSLSDEPLVGDESDQESGAPDLDLDHVHPAVVILLTDGENTETPDPLEAAQVAAEAGVRVYPVGIGTPAGAVIDVEGFQILTQLNPDVLQQIADTTNGVYYAAQDDDSLREVYREVELQLTTRGERQEVTSIFAGVSLLVLLVAGGLALAWWGRMT